MARSLTPNDIKRLAFSRFLYQEGVKHSRLPAPLSSTALLSFHDAVENFLGLTAEFLGVEVDPKISFMQYWGEVKAKAKIELPSRASMTKLNNARVSLKHHGHFPATETIEQSRVQVVNFFNAAAPVVFNIDFDTVDMVDLVTQPEVGQLLREAQTHADIGDYSAAMAGLKMAFAELLRHYGGRVSMNSAQSTPFAFGPRAPAFFKPRGHPELNDLAAQITYLRSVAQELREAMQMTSLGIDYPSYGRFAALVPLVPGYFNGEHRWFTTKDDDRMTAENYSSCRLFVIESTLQAARADEVLDLLRTQAEADRHPSGEYVERTWTGPAETS